MEEHRARALLEAERQRIQELLATVATAEAAEWRGAEEPTDVGDDGQRLSALGTEGLVADALHDRLAALDRAEQRLAAGTFGLSVRSGRPLPEERLEADPAAELTVEEAETR
jgi:DnaK suppressor protein